MLLMSKVIFFAYNIYMTKKLVLIFAVIFIGLSLVFFSPQKNSYADSDKEKTVYLTFDDGPTKFVTDQILDVLEEREIKATFFVIGKMANDYKEVLKRIYQGGHTIALHGYSHDYKKIFSSPSELEKDILTCIETIKRILPDCNLSYFRFPGGSYNLSNRLKEVPKKLNLTTVDWNAIIGDGDYNDGTIETYKKEFLKTVNDKNNIILLMHDTKKNTAKCLPYFIDYFTENGYSFRKF